MTWGRGSTRAWRDLRATVLRRDPTCQLRYDVCTLTSTDVDHVIPLAEGGTDHPDNLQGVCANCHGVKTQRERVRGQKRRREEAKQNREPHPGAIPPGA